MNEYINVIKYHITELAHLVPNTDLLSHLHIDEILRNCDELQKIAKN